MLVKLLVCWWSYWYIGEAVGIFNENISNYKINDVIKFIDINK